MSTRTHLTAAPDAPPVDYDLERDRFWAAIADAAETALKNVSLDNPDAITMHALTRTARAAAGPRALTEAEQ